MRATHIFGVIIISTISLGSATVTQKCPQNKFVVCYWASWAKYRTGRGAHSILHIVPEYCTHLVYSFAGINIKGDLDSLDYDKDIKGDEYKKFVKLKEKNPCLKVLLGVGGWSEGSEKFSLLAETKESRKKFVDSVIHFLIYFGFDGIDLDWEYPTQRGGLREDKENFIALIEDLKKRLSPRNRIVTAAVPAALYLSKDSYDIEKMCSSLDFVSIMGYELHDAQKTSTHAPIFLENSESNERDTVHATVQYFRKNNCPSEKIVLGIPTFGKSYTLKSEANIGLGAPVQGPGKASNFSNEPGSLFFNEICDILREGGDKWQKIHLDKSVTDYATDNDQWVSYDGLETVKLKAEYILRENLAGAMIWSIDMDDFHGICYQRSYPLLSEINKVFGYTPNALIKLK